jgi:hypothetical protein
MRFVLTLELGNDAMQTQGDIARALRAVVWGMSVERLGTGRTPEIGDSGPIRDVNGNRVGSWHVEESK